MMKSYIFFLLTLVCAAAAAQTYPVYGPGDVITRGTTVTHKAPQKFNNAALITNATVVYVKDPTTGFMKTMNASLISGGGSGASARLLFTSPADGTKNIQSDSMIGKDVNVWAGGTKRTPDDSLYNGVKINKTTGTATFYPPLLAGEQVIIDYGTITTTNIAAYTPTLDFINWATVNSGSGASYTSGTHTLNGGSDCSNNPHDYALGDKNIPAGQDGYIMFQYTSANENNILGFNTTNTNQKEYDGTNHNWEAGVLVYSGTVYNYDNHGAASAISALTLSLNDWVRINRTSGVVTIETAPNSGGSPGSWTSRWTFTNVSSLNTAALYPQANFPCFASFSNIKIYNGQ